MNGKVRCDRSAKEIANIIASIFNHCFGESENATTFLSEEEKVENELSP